MNILKDGDKIKRIFDIWEEIRQDGLEDGRQSVRDQIIEAKTETAKAKAMIKQQVERKAEAMRTALRLLMDGISIFKIAQYTGLSVQEVRELHEIVFGR